MSIYSLSSCIIQDYFKNPTPALSTGFSSLSYVSISVDRSAAFDKNMTLQIMSDNTAVVAFLYRSPVKSYNKD